MQFHQVIDCTIHSEPEKDSWLADISLIPKDIHPEHIYPIQYYFPCYPNLHIAETKIYIRNTETKDYLIVLCHQFAVYLREMIKLMREHKCAPLYWTVEDIMLWRAISDAHVKWQEI